MAIDKKRKRNEGHGKRSKAPPASSKRQKSNSGKRVVNVDALPWKSVDVPEMFDDAEGFYGLEEVEGVEVVREGGTVKFVTAADAESEDSEEFGGFDDPPEDAEVSPEGTEVKGSASEEPAAPEASAKQPKAAKKATGADGKDAPKRDAETQKEDKKRGKKEKQSSKVESANGDPELEANVFAQAASLAEAPAEDNDIDMSEWVPLGLSPQVLSAIARLKFAKPTAIQAKAIPHIMNGHDLIGKAATGSGKTLAFGIPIVESWLARRAEAQTTDKKQPIALILSPTRELAHQIRDHLKQLCAGLTTGPYVCSVTGGLAVQKQQRQFEKADILVGTPGRMWELTSSSNSVLGALRGISFLVVDEADRLLKDGHFKEAEEIMNALDRKAPGEEVEDDGDSDDETPRHNRQTLVFSATFNKNLQQKLAGKARYNLMGDAESLEYLLKKLNFREPRPKFVDTNPVSQMAENLREGLIQCGDLEKDLYLYAVLLLQPTRRALVFTNSINTVRRLTPFLQALNLPAFALHSDMEQKARLRSIERFRAGANAANNKKNSPAPSSSPPASSILVATDVAARGLDIPEIDLVIHYHVPRTADDYVHRSGRTARANHSGISILLCGPKEAVPTRRLIAKVHAAAAAAAHTPRAKLASAGVGVQTVDIDRRLVAHLRPRVTLAKKITETTIAKERGAREEDWLRKAADELGVEYDPDELEAACSWKGRGSGRKMREKEAAAVSKAEVKQWRWELKELLSKRVNTGVSERYLNGVDVDALLRGARGEFLGQVEGLGL
ncbi:P-loop containing nucleoside triphosphate hydrolase protein [Thermothelomyces heterothallicus CBS 202.75]|uniref:P-loop containing nucleoside triphosphate hydrolase protein n=1 Tax=Thermothelomyces heterothallicus CBS 202.75 TaxID=1149848 RepID=UPI0037442F08